MANFESPDLAFSSKEGYGEDSGLAVYVTQAIDATVKWDDIAWLKRLTSLPVVVKGVLTGEWSSYVLCHLWLCPKPVQLVIDFTDRNLDSDKLPVRHDVRSKDLKQSKVSFRDSQTKI